MRVFVTGGTGAIGRYAVPVLIDAGHTVTALARNPSKAADLRAQGANPALVSLFDHPALAAAFAGHDAVINLASALPSTTAFWRYSAWRAVRTCAHRRVRPRWSTPHEMPECAD